jgi:cytoskeleton protein RodZ
VTATEEQAPMDAGAAASAASAGPGARLRAAREAAGLSLDQVAQQLKLAPRQVKALEDESFGELPGRTFSRGFVRNYARLLHLDAGDLLAHLPDAAQAPALESPTLHSTGTMMAELPSSSAPKVGFSRWLIPLILIACIVGAAAYEWYRGGLNNVEPARPAAGTADRGAQDSASLASPAGTPSVALSNPLTSAPASAPPAAERDAAAVDADSTIVAAAAPDSAAPASSMASDSPPLILTYQGPSWTEIRDGSGQLVVSRLVAPGSVEPVKGAPPFDVVLGNAPAVTVAYRGKSVDLLPYTRQNVAHFTLR